MKITTILPVSRIKYLDRVLDSLTNQTRKPQNLIVVFDGADSEYVEVRNKVVQLDFENVLCVPSTNQRVAHAIVERRLHITNIHNQIKQLIEDCDWIFSIEDDGILPPDALEKLVRNIKADTGIVSGVELGRWGIPYVGAWIVDDIEAPSKVMSVDNKTEYGGIENIDACGLYCALIRADGYKQHHFFTNNGLGPDVNLALFLRRMGFQNYIDWSIHVTHLTYINGEEKEIPATSESKVITLQKLGGSTWKH